SGGVADCSKCGRHNEANSVFKAMARDLYDGEIAYVDHKIGRFIANLKQRGLYDDTVIAFVSDHGELMWDHGEYFGHGGPWLVDELTHVPLIIKPARRGGLARAKVVDSQVRSFDLMPTLLDLAGIDTSELDIEARSLLPFLATQGRALAGDRVAVSENIEQDILSVRHEGWKYVLFSPPGRPARERLYNLRTTAAEKADVAARNPAMLTAMRMHAMRHLMKNRRGRYLLVTGDGMPRSYNIRIKSTRVVRDAQTLFGLPLRHKNGGTLYTVEGRTSAPIVVFARIDAPADATFDIVISGSGSEPLRITRRLEPEAFEQFAAADAAGRVRVGQRVALHAFKAESNVERHERRQLSAQRLETLRAFGTVQ
ncbi:MAG: sulfatase-like hydrolase/transferase, partial [Myxococcota bacterium]